MLFSLWPRSHPGARPSARGCVRAPVRDRRAWDCRRPGRRAVRSPAPRRSDNATSVRDQAGRQPPAAVRRASHEFRTARLATAPANSGGSVGKLSSISLICRSCCVSSSSPFHYALQQTPRDRLIGDGNHPQQAACVGAGTGDKLVERDGERIVQISQFLRIAGFGGEQRGKLGEIPGFFQRSQALAAIADATPRRRLPAAPACPSARDKNGWHPAGALPARVRLYRR